MTVAVFDVDETLIRCKSMFSFLEYALVAKRGPAQGGQAYAAILHGLRRARDTLPREAVNRQFYRALAGWDLAELSALAAAWFKDHQKGLYIPETLARLREHQRLGHKTLLLSGSATFIIAPIAQDLAVDDTLAIALRRMPDGTTDGEIHGIQTIGAGKARALTAYLAQVDPAPDLIGYGDHESDLPFLRLCTRSFLVLPAQSGLPDWAKGLARLETQPHLVP